MSSHVPSLAVIVVNYVTSPLLAEHLPTLQSAVPDAVIVVVDNFSSQTERADVATLAEKHGWQFVAAEQNLGFGAGMNVGVAQAAARGIETVLLLNPDAVIDGPSVAALRDRVAADPLVAVSPVITRLDGSVWFDGVDLVLADGSMRSTRSRGDADLSRGVMPWLSGACLMLSVALFERVGGFDEEYFMYWEDVDLSRRILRAGGSVAVVRSANALHDEGGSQPSRAGEKSSLYYYFNIRNRLLFAARHLAPADRRRWRRSSPEAAYRILLRGGRRHLLTPTGPLPTALRATRDGLALSREPKVQQDDPLRVMLSFPPPLPTSNPYNVMMAESLAAVENTTVMNFSWRRALLGSYDIFHAHWPEATLHASSPAKRAVKQVLFAMLLAKVALTRTAWVRTVHNIGLPEGISRRERSLLRAAEALTTLRIILNSATRLPATQPHELIVHGDYVHWFERYPRALQRPGRILFCGTVRRYKGVPDLVHAFRQVDDPTLTLLIAGRLSHATYGAELAELCVGDDRIALDLDFLSDERLVHEISTAEIVVLPYPEMHNSGTVLCALSLDRPLLAPDNEVNRMLAAEVGPGWMHLFSGSLSGKDIEATLAALREAPPTTAPDLSARSWEASAARHVVAYRRARSLRTGLGGASGGSAP